jgi:hypothetical protein
MPCVAHNQCVVITNNDAMRQMRMHARGCSACAMAYRLVSNSFATFVHDGSNN